MPGTSGAATPAANDVSAPSPIREFMLGLPLHARHAAHQHPALPASNYPLTALVSLQVPELRKAWHQSILYHFSFIESQAMLQCTREDAY